MKEILRWVRTVGIFSGIIFIMILLAYPPNSRDTFLLSSFFASLFLFVGSTITLLIYQLRVRSARNQTQYAAILPSLRTGFLIGLGITFTLFLNTLQILTLWNALLSWTGLIIVELFFRSGK